MLFYSESTLQLWASRRLCRFQISQFCSLASFRMTDAYQSATSVRTTRTFRLNAHQRREASNCSSLHPSRRFSSTSRRHSVFDQLWDFLPKHSFGKIAVTVRTTWIPVQTRSFIRQVSHSNPDVWTSVLLVRTHEHQIWKLRASDQPSGRPSPWSGLGKPWYGNYLQRKCNHLEDRVPPFGRGYKQERISAKFLKCRSHSCSSGRPMTTVWTVPRFYQARRSFEPSAYK
jgi:hypothetical protein